MFVPFISTPSQDRDHPYRRRRLFPRKGGGGGGGGSKGGGATPKSSGPKPGSSGSKPGSSSTAGKTSVPGLGTSKSSTSYGNGGGKVSTIPAGQLFAGRTQGGGTRVQVFGSRAYGSGYPGAPGLGVANRNFPFYFWPVVWGGGPGIDTGGYLYSTEYGSPNNSNRPGGPQQTAAFQSSTTHSIFRIVSDNTTVSALLASITANCSSDLGSTSGPSPYNSSAPDAPQPEGAVEYYRASSVVLSLDGYNNTDALTGLANATSVPLPTGVDVGLLECLNQTIGVAVPLVDGAVRGATPGAGVLGVVAVLCWLLSGVY